MQTHVQLFIFIKKNARDACCSIKLYEYYWSVCAADKDAMSEIPGIIQGLSIMFEIRHNEDSWHFGGPMNLGYPLKYTRFTRLDTEVSTS